MFIRSLNTGRALPCGISLLSSRLTPFFREAGTTVAPTLSSSADQVAALATMPLPAQSIFIDNNFRASRLECDLAFYCACTFPVNRFHVPNAQELRINTTGFEFEKYRALTFFP